MSDLNFEDQKKITTCISRAVERLSLSQYEVYCFQAKHYTVEAKEGTVDFFQNAVERGLALRVIRGHKAGFSYTTDFHEPAIQQMVKSAWEGTQSMSEDPCRALPDISSEPASYKSEKGDFDDFSDDDKMDMALSLEDIAKSYDPRIKRVRKATYKERHVSVWLQSSNGIHREAQKSIGEIGVMALAEENGSQEMSWDMDFDEKFSRLKPREVAEKAARDAVALLGARPIESIQCPVVLDREVVCSLLGVLSPSFLADHVQKGKSFLAGKSGQQIYSPLISIVDDGRLEGGYNSFPFDAEGRPHRKNVVVDKGFLRHFLYDCYSAAKEKKTSTGNAIRPSFKEMPQLGITNFFIEPGTTSISDLEQGLVRGLWIVDVIGIHTANSISGDFSVGAVGFWYEGGKRQFTVRGIAVSGNLHNLFKGVEAVGSDLKFYQGIGAPSLRLKALDVGGC